MKQNYVATNLTQDFTDAEKAQARTNISAAKMHYINVVLGSGSIGEDAYSELTSAISAHEPVYIVTSAGATATYWQFKQANSTGYDFFTYGDNGMRNMHISTYRQVTITDEPLGNIYNEVWYEPRSSSISSTNHYDGMYLGRSEDYVSGVYKYHEVMGTVTFEPKHTGNIAFCPYKNVSTYDSSHGSQCSNMPVTAGQVYTTTFYFHDTTYMNPETLEIETIPISGFIGIKGSVSEAEDPIIYHMVVQER